MGSFGSSMTVSLISVSRRDLPDDADFEVALSVDFDVRERSEDEDVLLESSDEMLLLSSGLKINNRYHLYSVSVQRFYGINKIISAMNELSFIIN